MGTCSRSAHWNCNVFVHQRSWMAAIKLTDYSRTIVIDHNSLIVRKIVLRVNFSVDFNFAGFFNELRFLSAPDYVGFHISPCNFQCSDNFANCCRPVVPQPCDNPVCLYAILATFFSPTSSHGCVFSAMVFRCWYLVIQC